MVQVKRSPLFQFVDHSPVHTTSDCGHYKSLRYTILNSGGQSLALDAHPNSGLNTIGHSSSTNHLFSKSLDLFFTKKCLSVHQTNGRSSKVPSPLLKANVCFLFGFSVASFASQFDAQTPDFLLQRVALPDFGSTSPAIAFAPPVIPALRYKPVNQN